jgi:hypothetical protein
MESTAMERHTIKYAAQLRRKSDSVNTQAKTTLTGLHDALAMTRLRIKSSLKSIERSDRLILNLNKVSRPYREMLKSD